MTNQQKEAIGYMIIAVRACHLTGHQEEKIESAMIQAMNVYLPQDAINLYNSIDQIMPDGYEQAELNYELQVELEVAV